MKNLTHGMLSSGVVLVPTVAASGTLPQKPVIRAVAILSYHDAALSRLKSQH